MGVPAFFRWLSRKYPSVIIECVENKVFIQFLFISICVFIDGYQAQAIHNPNYDAYE